MLYQHEILFLLYTQIVTSFWNFVFTSGYKHSHLPVLFRALYFQWTRKNFKRLTDLNGIKQRCFSTHFLALCSLHLRFQELLTRATPTDADKN
jgi:hypothetical protein